jgi:hypothetical protein
MGARHVSGITFTIYAQNRNIGKPNNLKFESDKTKGLKQDSQNQISPEGGDKIGNKKDEKRPHCLNSSKI